MSLAAALNAGGARPASFLPTIKCSQCGDQIEISAMGDHTCGGSTPSAPSSAPASAHTSIASTSSNGSSASSNGNPFALRTTNLDSTKPTTPSPLQFDSDEQKPPQTRVRAPTLGSREPPRHHRPAPPQINPDTANKPFLAPVARPESPISPALSSKSGSGLGSRPPPLRSVTSPAPRIFDPRPPSPELSANLDCAFPPFPTSSTTSSRPSTSNGGKTPSSDRAPSRGGGSRQDGRWPAERDDFEPKSPRPNGGENVMERMNTLRSGPFDESRRRPSKDERQEHTSGPHGRRPSMPQNPPTEPLPSLPTSKFSQPQKAPPAAERAPSPERKGSGDKKIPPQRPVRPETAECLSPSFLSQFSAEPVSLAAKPSSSDSETPTEGLDQSQAFPFPLNKMPSPELTKVKSEPDMRGRQRRPTLNGESKSDNPMPYPPRSQSRNGDRVDHRLDNAPPVPKPVQQLNRSNSQHRPSESGSSTASSVKSMSNSNSSADGPSPIGSAASSIDAFSPLSSETEAYGEDKGMRVPGLNIKHQKPGMRAELPREKKSPPRDFSRPMLQNEPAPPPPEEDQELPNPAGSSWPLESPMESPMDPAMMMTHPPQRPGVAPLQQQRSMTTPNVHPEPAALSVPNTSANEYDPFRPKSPVPQAPPQQRSPPSQHQPPHMRARSKTNTGPVPRVASPDQRLSPMPRSRSPQPFSRPFSPAQSGPPPSQPAAAPRSISPQSPPRRPFSPPQHAPQRPFSPPQATSPASSASSTTPRPFPPPPIPQDAPTRPGLARRQTSGKSVCRGCNQLIEGKSVKAADGRLTGRWHKACFVCRTCTQPFTTADFYVIENQPFCEQHYHEKNGSLCQGCWRGIEGQYLETAATAGGSRKFHPRCFTCADCRVVLSDDYFEIGGRVFCERHALANMRSQARMGGGPPGPGQYGPGASNLGPGPGAGAMGPGGPTGGLQLPGGCGARNPLTAAKRSTRLMMM